MKKIRVASLFSGAGGLDYGFQINDNYEVVFANELNKDAAQTYRLNYGSEHMNEGCLSQFYKTVPDHDLLIFGFPCQPFTIAGKRKGFEDERADIFIETLEILKNKQPSYFLMENVKGLLSQDNGNAFNKFLNEFDNVNYNTYYKLLKFNEYGIPQTRERVFIFGIRKDINLDGNYIFNIEKKEAPILKEILKDVENKFTLGTGLHNNTELTKILKHWCLILKEGENAYNLTIGELRHREKKLNLENFKPTKSLTGYRKLDSNKVAPTMMFGNNVIPFHPYENRRLSVRECLSIQTFPDDFKMSGSISAKFKQIGNAVSPKMSEILANNIIDLHKNGDMLSNFLIF